MENQFCRVVQWVDDSTKLFDSIQLFEETISYHIGRPPVKVVIDKSQSVQGSDGSHTPRKITRLRPGYLLST